MAKIIVNKTVTKKRGNPNWKKGGPSPNPAGAPKRGASWREIIDIVGDEIKQGGKYANVHYKHAVVQAMFEEASNKGNTNAANWLARYGGGVTEFSNYTDDQLRHLIAQRLGIDPHGSEPGHLSDEPHDQA